MQIANSTEMLQAESFFWAEAINTVFGAQFIEGGFSPMQGTSAEPALLCGPVEDREGPLHKHLQTRAFGPVNGCRYGQVLSLHVRIWGHTEL